MRLLSRSLIFLMAVACIETVADMALSPVALSAEAAKYLDISPLPKNYVACVNPDPYRLMGGGFAALESVQYFYYGANLNRWVFISWGAPPGGMVFVLACDGRVIAERYLGHLEKFDEGPTVNGKETVEVRYISATGTGTFDRSVSLLRFDGKFIVDLWDHDANDFGSIPERDGRWLSETDVYDWEYQLREPVAEIRVTGTRKTELNGRTHTRGLPPEKYCYREDKNKFVRC